MLEFYGFETSSLGPSAFLGADYFTGGGPLPAPPASGGGGLDLGGAIRTGGQLAQVGAQVAAFEQRVGNQKLAATQIVNQAEPLLAANRDAYLTQPRFESTRQEALDYFLRVWAQVVRALSAPELGEAGRRGIAERDDARRGRGTGEWDWWAYYYYPIADDGAVPGTGPGPLPNLVPDLPGAPVGSSMRYLPWVAAGVAGILVVARKLL